MADDIINLYVEARKLAIQELEQEFVLQKNYAALVCLSKLKGEDKVVK